MIRKHIDFDLWIGLDDVKARCEGREARAEIQLDPFEREMEELAQALRKSPEISGSDLGKRLYDAVFVKQVRDLMAVNLPRKGAKRGLRIRLRLHRKVSGWLWELLNTGGSFLSMSIKTPVVRDMAGDPFPVVRTAWPIRVLVVVPSPPGSAHLDADQEVADIRRALGWRETLGLVKIEKLEPPTLSALKERLDAGRYHVLHFIGHGALLQDQGPGALLFESAHGEADPVDGERLAGLLDDEESLRLVILNACGSAQSAGEDLFGGVAQSLARQRIPAVVGMQYPIYDNMALAFSRRFYGALARRRPVDWALSRGRQAMRAAGKGLDWAIPVLFLSASDGKLFPWKPSWGMAGALLLIPLMLFGYFQWQSEVSVPYGIPQPAGAKLCPPVEGLDMEFVWIPAGSLMMGSERGPKDEKPLHKVVISRPFCLGAHEVSQKQWEAFMGANSVNAERRGESLPVSSISWDDAQEWLRRVNNSVGRQVVRFPREAEWEYAARGPGGLPAISNCLRDPAEDPAPVLSPRPSRWGTHYMHGNVWEWVQDWHGDYPQGSVIDPQGPPSGERKVKRGGGYDSASQKCRPATRNSAEPDSRRYDVGFRVLRELEQ